ncbi:hypothetical protein AB1L30_15735 [Bremerella sp. JC817]|uniref:hypothetical protein n=1 Tax=Bremerella sp. JC817 TaxID=3231756 RepID=UPI0034582AEA
MTTLTLSHVIISLVAIAAGLVAFYGMTVNQRYPRWTAVFLVTTILTSLSGFLFPITKVTPGIVFGVLSLIALSLATVALYAKHLRGGWRATYIVTAIFSLYLNVVVLIVQSFQKIPVLHAFAPTQSEPAFMATQLITLVAFLGFGYRAIAHFAQEAAPTKLSNRAA